MKVRGNKIVVGTVAKAKIGELEEESRVGSSRRMRKELAGVVQAIPRKRRFLVRFHYGCEKNLYLINSPSWQHMRSWWRRHPWCLRFLRYRMILSKVIRGTMFVSMFY